MSHTNNASPIITSLLDTDFYKLTMMQCVFHHFKNTQARYKFISRRNHIGEKLGAHQNDIQDQINQLCALTFKSDEIEYLQTLGFFQDDFLNYLKNFQLNARDITITADNTHFSLEINGSWLETILFEVPILAIISESYTRVFESNELLENAIARLEKKVDYLKFLPRKTLKDFRFSDFGTRRRFSKKWHQYVVEYIYQQIPEYLYGTSNLYLAKNLDIPPIGTMAHEYIQAFQVLAPRLDIHQKTALEVWLKEYHGLLTIALTDTINMDSFLKEFTPELARKFRGLRHDSGDPIVWGKKAIDYYEKNNISLKEKLLVFSDSLTFEKMVNIYQTFQQAIPVLFGIGTHLTNDFSLPSLDIVVKLTHVNNQAVIKISDTPNKIVCEDNNYLKLIKETYQLTL